MEHCSKPRDSLPKNKRLVFKVLLRSGPHHLSSPSPLSTRMFHSEPREQDQHRLEDEPSQGFLSPLVTSESRIRMNRSVWEDKRSGFCAQSKEEACTLEMDAMWVKIKPIPVDV